MPKVCRLALLPIAVLIELLLLASAWLLALVSPSAAGVVVALAKHLPEAGWYKGRA